MNSIEPQTAGAPALLEIQNLSISFQTLRGRVRVLRDLSLKVRKGEIFAIIGESGCGKSVTAKSINCILPKEATCIESGKILLQGSNLLEYNEKQMRGVRGSRISMIFQEPMTSLNPTFTVGQQLMDVFVAKQRLRRSEARRKAIEVLQKVHIPSPELRLHNYPHEMSGGMQQRVMIAMALAAPAPALLIADEPTTALDVTIQAQILALLCELRDQMGLTILLITHDIGLVVQYADRMAVMYCGKKVEEGRIEDVFAQPRHPYTRGLLQSLPGKRQMPAEKENTVRGNGKRRLHSISGSVPDLRSLRGGCPFYSRCEFFAADCLHHFPQETLIRHAEASEARGYDADGAGSAEAHVVYCHHVRRSLKPLQMPEQETRQDQKPGGPS